MSAEKYSLVPFTSGWEVQEALIAGRVDAAILPFTYVWNAAAKGYPVKTISFFERETDAVVALQNIKSASDLNGKKVGLLKASSLDVLWRDYAAAENISAEPVYFRSPNEAVAALQKAEVSAVVLYVPIVNKLADDFNIIHWFGDSYAAHPCCDLAVNTRQVNGDKAKQLALFVQELDANVTNMFTDANGAKAYAKSSYGLSDAQVQGALKHSVFRMGLEQSGRKFQRRMAEISLEAGYLDKIPTDSEVYWDIND
jgi:ABC-type nitrate/sulfonate/bicarbonate transport system substrate-binding protein